MSDNEMRDAVREQIAQAFGPEVMAWVEADVDGYGRAHAEMKAREAEYRAAMPSRLAEIADELSGMLPEGMRFEWGPPDA